MCFNKKLTVKTVKTHLNGSLKPKYRKNLNVEVRVPRASNWEKKPPLTAQILSPNILIRLEEVSRPCFAN